MEWDNFWDSLPLYFGICLGAAIFCFCAYLVVGLWFKLTRRRPFTAIIRDIYGERDVFAWIASGLSMAMLLASIFNFGPAVITWSALLALAKQFAATHFAVAQLAASALFVAAWGVVQLGLRRR